MIIIYQIIFSPSPQVRSNSIVIAHVPSTTHNTRWQFWLRCSKKRTKLMKCKGSH